MKVFGGLAWPEEANNCFLCIVVEKTEPSDKTLERPREYIEVISEYSLPDIYDIFTKIKETKHLNGVYADVGSKYQSFVREYVRWKRDNNCNVSLRMPQISSFEAGVLKIKKYTMNKLIIFPEQSMIKGQLSIFSKLSLKNPLEFGGVMALANVINAFDKRPTYVHENEPDIKSWY